AAGETKAARLTMIERIGTIRETLLVLLMADPIIAVIAFDGISPFHLSVPCLVFGENRTALGVPPFRLLVCAATRGRLRTSGGFDIEVAHDLAALRRAQVIIVPSWRDDLAAPPPALLEALRRAHRRGAQIVG